MVRSFFVALLALVLGNLVIVAAEAATWTLYPPLPGFSFADPEAVKTLVATMPLGAYAGVELGYALASAVAGATVGWLGRGRPWVTEGVLGVAFTLSNLMNLQEVPAPTGFAVLTTATFLPVLVGTAYAVRRGRSGGGGAA
jgi:hypothetical protein